MKGKNVIALGLLVLAAVFIIYLIQPGSLGSKKVTPPEAQAQTGHQHGSAPPEKPASPPAKQTEQAQPQEEAPTIEISPEKQQLIGVKMSTAAVRPLRKIIRTVGLIEYDQRQQTAINTKVEGWIEKLFVNYGDVREERAIRSLKFTVRNYGPHNRSS